MGFLGVIVLVIFGIGYGLGALLFDTCLGKNYTVLGGVLGGLGAIVVVVGIVLQGCSRYHY